jgi:23S rRNA pseudouridine2605 synthase
MKLGASADSAIVDGSVATVNAPLAVNRARKDGAERSSEICRADTLLTPQSYALRQHAASLNRGLVKQAPTGATTKWPPLTHDAGSASMKSKRPITLDRVLSRMGLASRTSGRQAIRSGRLKVNGRVVRDPKTWVDLGRDTIQLDGRQLKSTRRTYLLFYKPKGVITSHGDPAGRRTVYDCLAASRASGSGDKRSPEGRGIPLKPTGTHRWVFPVGRLDKHTSGLLLLTNDTEFADFVANPESGIPKTYLVKISGLATDEIVSRLNAGVQLKRGDWAHPLRVCRLADRGKYTWLEVVLTEGKNREVRRMIEAVGFNVLKLVRTAIGPLTLEGLSVGRWRELTGAEVAGLRQRQNLRLRA